MSADKKSTLYRFQERMRIARQGGAKIDIPFLLSVAGDLRSAEDRVKWLEQMLLWIRVSGGASTSQQTSLRFLLTRLEQNQEWKRASAAAVQEMLLQSSFVPLFSDSGVHSNYDFMQEGIARIVKRFFPAFGDPSEMDTAIDRIFHDDGDAIWVENLSPEMRAQIEKWLFSNDEFKEKFRDRLIGQSSEACTFLCIRASAIAIQREMMERAGRTQAMQIPPLRLRWYIEDFFTDLLSGKSREKVESSYREIQTEMAASRKYLDDVHAHLEQYGVSVRLVFGLESLASILNRIEALLQLAYWLRFPNPSYDPWKLFVSFLRDSWNEKRVMPLIKSNFHLLSRKIVEKAGSTGENYITANRGEYLAMFYAALGGGFLTAFTGLAKYLGPAHFPPFLLGAFAALNYSLSFVVMHHLHFKLATKQPAMTAAALAERLRVAPSEGGLGDFIDLVARISRSQFAAVAGNILAVIPTALAIDLVSHYWAGHHILKEDYAFKTLDTLHPFATFTVLYAAITGGLLWLSGLISGWVENAYVYFHVPKALQSHPFLANFFGERPLGAIIGKITKNLSGWTSSIALGTLLAFVPVIGIFFGLPLDVRHVTLSTGSVSYSLSSIGWANVPSATLLYTALGILLIAAMNFGVSFALALHIAIRANDIPGGRVMLIVRACLSELLRKPGKFFFP